MTTYDTLIIGGGPAGLSASIYLARFNRKVGIIDRGDGRTNTYEVNENYLGFPNGVPARELVDLGKKQAERFGVEFIEESANKISKEDDLFIVEATFQTFNARSLILCTGVTDLYPDFPNHEEFLGKSLFWCITCDGYKTINKKVVIVGDTDDAACDALQFLQYTTDISFVTNYPAGQAALSPEWRQRLWDMHVPVYDSKILKVTGTDGQVQTLELESGEVVPVEILINQQGAVPNNSLATSLGVIVNGEGYIETNEEQRTNIPFVYAAGDVTRAFSHQIVTAAHEGSMAAQAANYDLYLPEQRMS